MVVIGTGFNGPFNAVGGFVKAYGTFVGGFFENESSITLEGSVQAICAQVSGGFRRSERDYRAQYEADLAAAERVARAK